MGRIPAGGFVFGAMADSLGSSASLIIGCGFVILVTISIGIFNPEFATASDAGVMPPPVS